MLADRIAEGLRDQGMAVDVAYDGATAMEVTAFTGYDVIVLDRDLPRVHGDAVCAQLVAGRRRARILMLTAAAGVEDRVDGLNLGRRRLPRQAVRVRRAGRAGPGPRQAQPVRAAGGAARRPDRGPGPAAGQPGGAAGRADPQGVRRARGAASPPTAAWSAPRSCSSTCGTRTSTRSATRCRSPFPGCAGSWRPAADRDRHRQRIPAMRPAAKTAGMRSPASQPAAGAAAPRPDLQRPVPAGRGRAARASRTAWWRAPCRQRVSQSQRQGSSGRELGQFSRPEDMQAKTRPPHRQTRAVQAGGDRRSRRGSPTRPWQDARSQTLNQPAWSLRSARWPS